MQQQQQLKRKRDSSDDVSSSEEEDSEEEDEYDNNGYHLEAMAPPQGDSPYVPQANNEESGTAIEIDNSSEDDDSDDGAAQKILAAPARGKYTKRCRFFFRGICKKGAACQFSHEAKVVDVEKVVEKDRTVKEGSGRRGRQKSPTLL